MLNIQKVVLLLSDDHLNMFKRYLDESGYQLSLKLVGAIEKHGQNQPDSDVLCTAIYESSDEKTKRKFFQLVHHTFKLTAFLARNYPFYLVHNLSRIGQMVNAGAVEEANVHAELLLDLAEKIEDWSTLNGVLKFLSHQAFVMESQRKTLAYHRMIQEVCENELTANKLYMYMRDQLNFKDKNSLTNPETEKHLRFFDAYLDHPTVSIQVLAKYGRLHTLNYLDDPAFYEQDVYDEIVSIQKALEKHSYTIIHFADEIPLKVDYMYLKHVMHRHDEQAVLKASMQLLKKWHYLQFWKGYINIPQLISVSIQASYYLTYYCYGYRHDRTEMIPKEVQEKIQYLQELCQDMLDKPKWESGYYVRYINLNNIYCSFLVLSGQEACKKAISIIEGLLINYQQIAFQRLYDSIFATLILAYFSIEDLSGVQECYKRYEKLTAHQVKVEENDLTIKGIYYLSQWRATERNQYLEKLRATYSSTHASENLKGARKVIREMAEYYQVPLEMNAGTA